MGLEKVTNYQIPGIGSITIAKNTQTGEFSAYSSEYHYFVRGCKDIEDLKEKIVREIPSKLEESIFAIKMEKDELNKRILKIENIKSTIKEYGNEWMGKYQTSGLNSGGEK